MTTASVLAATAAQMRNSNVKFDATMLDAYIAKTTELAQLISAMSDSLKVLPQENVVAVANATMRYNAWLESDDPSLEEPVAPINMPEAQPLFALAAVLNDIDDMFNDVVNGLLDVQSDCNEVSQNLAAILDLDTSELDQDEESDSDDDFAVEDDSE